MPVPARGAKFKPLALRGNTLLITEEARSPLQMVLFLAPKVVEEALYTLIGRHKDERFNVFTTKCENKFVCGPFGKRR